MKELSLKGVFTALITPFNADEHIDFGTLKKIVEWQIEKGINGLVPVGTTGESPTLSHKEHAEVIAAVIEQTNGRVPIIAGTGSNSTHEAIELTREAKKLGADACLQVAPYYNKPSQDGFYQHFMRIADSVDLPIILYNIPGRTSKAIELDTMYRLFEHPNIIGIKEASGNITNAMSIIQRKTALSKNPNHSTKHASNTIVLSGDDAIALAMVTQGGDGVISVLSNIFPEQITSMIATALDNKIELARAQFYKLYEIMNAMFIDSNPIPIKYAASKLGLCQEVYRLPLCPLSQSHKQHIDALLDL